jgi:PAS domain S-box-containing protein
MRQILQQMPNGVIVADAEGSVTMRNPRSRELLGGDPDRPIDDPAAPPTWLARRPDGSRYARGEAPLDRAARDGEVVLGERMTIERADGSLVTIEADAAPIRGTDDAIIGAVAVFQDVTLRVETEEHLARSTTRLRQIQAVTDAALSGLPFDELARRLLETLRQVLGTDSATLLLVDRSGDALLEHTTVGVETGGPDEPVPLGAGIAGTIASTVRPVVIDDLSTRTPVRHWLADHMASLMGAPLVYRGRVRGVIHVASRTSRHFSDDEVQVLTLAANRVASALERAALYDSRSAMASALQRSLVPTSLPHVAGMEMAAIYRPFSPNDEIGGDFYDVFPHGGGTWGVVVGDVSGKGPDAAAVMGLAAHTIRAIAPYEARPSTVLRALNDALLREERVAAERFCTACQLRVHPSADHLRVTVCLAGHPRPMLVHGDGAVAPVGEPGTLLGTFDDPTLHDVSLDLRPGDAIVTYTDGLIERRGIGIDDGERVLAGLLRAHAGEPADDLQRAIEAELLGSAEPDDDVAVVVVRKT